MRLKTCIVLCILVVCPRIYAAPGVDDSTLTIENVRSEWQKRHALIKSAYYQIDIREIRMINPADILNPRPRGDSPDGDETFQVECNAEIRILDSLVDIRRTVPNARSSGLIPFARSAFDGEESRQLHEFNSATPQGFIDTRPHVFDIDVVDYYPIMVACRPLEVGISRLDLASFVPIGAKEIGGRPCVGFAEQTDRPLAKELWLDRERGYSLVRYLRKARGKDNTRIDIVNEKVVEGLWVPKSWRTVFVGSEGDLVAMLECDVTSVQLNLPLRKSEFSITFPNGTRIVDQSRGIEYVMSPGVSWTWILRLALLVSVCCGLIIAVYCYRSYKRR